MAEWKAFSGEEFSRYSPLDQINRDNVKNLQVAWTWRFDNYGTATETLTTETTPLMVNGVLYFHRRSTAECHRGERRHRRNALDLSPGRRRALRSGAAQDSPWRRLLDRRQRPRAIFTATPGFNLVSLDAKTGQLVDSFGENGIVDMMKQMDDKSLDPVGKIGNSSPPVVIGNVVVDRPGLDSGWTREQGQRQARRECVRRSHRQEGLDLPHDSAQRRVRL
jgi:quinoprotein glucose dehydrogenase